MPRGACRRCSCPRSVGVSVLADVLRAVTVRRGRAQGVHQRPGDLQSTADKRGRSTMSFADVSPPLRSLPPWRPAPPRPTRSTGSPPRNTRRSTRSFAPPAPSTTTTLFPLIELQEPAKADVLAWTGGAPPDRRATVHYTGTDGFREAIVNITARHRRERRADRRPADGALHRVHGALTGALEDPEMIAGLAEARA